MSADVPDHENISFEIPRPLIEVLTKQFLICCGETSVTLWQESQKDTGPWYVDSSPGYRANGSPSAGFQTKQEAWDFATEFVSRVERKRLLYAAVNKETE